ncbi:MAG TPA: citramalate synthase [Candidatus Borkfalkia faecavium]|uniref:Citramalate synthase n=1 Tax=Candidatus Borkfalkia faecavium TaxID=2838508 RepID=A0A9D1W1T2_9FIRM|nr:citramalate synthase [Candidatus Borkfalkia faecavium]
MKLQIFDSTLRDGAQGANISFSVEDKVKVIEELDKLGVDFIEAGNPYSNPAEMQFFQRIRGMKLQNAQIVAFGSTRRKGVPAAEDANLKSLLAAGTDYVAIFGKSHIRHATDVLKATPEENLEMIYDSVRFLASQGKQVIFDAEHFFDGYKTDETYAMAALARAAEAGAYCLCLCDTNGGIFPDEAYRITRAVCERFPDVIVAIHCHNDGGLAVADSIEAVKAGAKQVQGTFLGFGERCGNTNLSTVICNLQLKRGYECIPPENLKDVYGCAMAIAETANTAVPDNQPYIGMNAFAHKAGMHADGVLKYSSSFEHIDPAIIGNKRKFLLSEISGKSAIYDKLKSYFPSLDKNGREMGEIVAALKERALAGYQYEAAEASFVLLVEKILGKYTNSFDLISYKIINEQPAIEGKVASAIVKIRVNGVTKIAASDGEGPVHAMDLALRAALADFYPEIARISLTDFKVRVLDSAKATAAKVRVLITTADSADSWTTVGVSEDVIEASWIALTDSIDYMLMRRR